MCEGGVVRSPDAGALQEKHVFLIIAQILLSIRSRRLSVVVLSLMDFSPTAIFVFL